jgi:hypothetical protein
VIAVILSYLGGLSVEHQRYWSSFEIHERCFLDPDYFRTNFEAEFSDRVSIFKAFIQELEEINKICSLISWPPLFKETFIDNPPTEFNWLTKPTAKEYSLFIHTLDKLLSENINKEFFSRWVPLQEELSRKDGKIKIVDKGTTRLLEEFIAKKWRFPDPKPAYEMIKTFKTIRKMRQEPAHKTIEDKYDFKYNQKQRDIMYQAYSAIRTLRLLLANHPKAKSSYVPPDWLQRGRIG